MRAGAFIPRRPGSSTAKMTTGAGRTTALHSTSWATPSNRDERRTGGGKFFVSFPPAISAKAASAVRATIRDWRMASTRNNQSREDIARLINPTARGWLNYFGRFYRAKCMQVLRHLNEALAAWARRRKYKRPLAARASVDVLAGGHRSSRARPRCALACWREAVELDWKCRMRRECHVRWREGPGVQPRATRRTGSASWTACVANRSGETRRSH